MVIFDKSLSDRVCKSYIICSTQRSGSTLLSKTLTQLGDCGKPDEYFNLAYWFEKSTFTDRSSFLEYYERVLEQGTSENGVFGIKLHWYQLKALSAWLRDHVDDFRDSSPLETLNSLFPSSQFIYIYRKDTLKQAISLSIAMQTKEWARAVGSGESSNKPKNLRFNPAQIRGCRNKTEKSNKNWQAFFEANSLDFYSIAYEDFVVSYEETIKEVYSFLGVKYSHGTITIPTEKQANGINDRWLFYYKTVPQPLVGIFTQLLSKISGDS